MNYHLLRTILFGAVLGAALFWAPFFILKVLLFFMILGFFFRGFRGRRYYGPSGWAYADKIRNMSDEEYASFKENVGGRCGHQGWRKSESKSEES